MPTSATQTYGEGRLHALYNPEDALEVNVHLGATQTLAAGTVLGQQTGTNAQQTITITGTPTGGTFTLTFRGYTTAPIAYSASAATVVAALKLLPSITSAGVSGTGGSLPGTAVVITFIANLGSQPVELMTADGSLLSGGTTPAIAVSNTVTGIVGPYIAYTSGASDGSQTARGLLQYATVVDGSGNATMPGEWGVTALAVPMFIAGIFRCEDTVGLTAQAVTDMGGYISSGTVTHGTFTIG